MSTHSSILVWEIPWTDSLADYSPQGCKEWDKTEWLNTHTHTHLMYTYISCTYIYPEYLYFIYLYIFCITKPTSKSLNFSSQCYWWLWELNRTLNVFFPILVYVAWFFPVVMYKCENQTIKKAEHWRIDAFEVWCWRRLESPLDCKEIKPVHPKGNQS